MHQERICDEDASRGMEGVDLRKAEVLVMVVHVYSDVMVMVVVMVVVRLPAPLPVCFLPVWRYGHRGEEGFQSLHRGPPEYQA